MAAATSIRLRPLGEMVDHAHQIVEGRVVAARAVPEGEGLIFTEYEVEVGEWLKGPGGARPARVIIRQPGGSIGETAMVVPGVPHFVAGEDVVLFTRDYSGRGAQQVANGAQGALRIEPAGAGPGGAPRRVPAAGIFPGGAPDGLEAFKAAIREFAGRRP